MKEIRLVHSARNDIANTLAYYQQTGVGEAKFKSLVAQRLDQIASFPSGLLPVKPEITSSPLSTKRADQKAFPYHIYYTSSDTSLIVLSIMIP